MSEQKETEQTQEHAAKEAMQAKAPSASAAGTAQATHADTDAVRATGADAGAAAQQAPVPAVRYDHVSKVYDDAEDAEPAVDDASFSVADHDFAMFVGSSGGGKTTLLKMANGLIAPTSGAVYYFGEDVAHTDQVKLRRKIGYVIQGSMLFPNMTVEKNILYVPRLRKFSKEQQAEALERALALTGIDSKYLTKYPAALSGGQQQRVGIARALAGNPDVVLMDEPFSAVDEITRRQLQTEIIDIHRKAKLTILFVTHDIDEALRLGTKIMVINRGKMQQFGTPDELLAHPATSYVEQLLADHD
jgi:osmoprotectant transport system ATP-binding protein